jgi:hypothetical protein
MLVAGLLVALAVPSGCGSTGSKRFTFETRAGGARDAGMPYTFTNGTGWTITLTKATVTVGPIYLNVVAPLRTASRWSLFKSAYADEAHLGGGRVVGEVLGQVTVDALSSRLVTLGSRGTITEEQVRTAEIWLWPPPQIAPETIGIDAPAADFAGEAVRGSEHVRFRGTIVIDDAWASDAKAGDITATPITEIRQIRGIPASFFPEEGGALEIRVDVKPLFRGADFSTLANNPVDADGTVRLVQAKSGPVTTDQVMRNAFQGLRASRGTYDVRWTTGDDR